MNKQIEFTVNPEYMRLLGKMAGLSANNASPLKYGSQEELTPDIIRELKVQEILGDENNIKPEYKDILSRLSAPLSFARVRFSFGAKVLEYTVYYDEKDEIPVSIQNTADGLKIVYYPTSEDITDSIRQFTGDSLVMSTDFEAEFSPKDASVFGILIDLERKALLKSVINPEDVCADTYSIDEVVKEIKSNNPNNVWFRDVIGEMCDLDYDQINKETINKGLENLVSKTETVEKIKAIASRFLLVDNIISITAGRAVKKDEYFLTGFTCLQSGVNDILLIEGGQDKVGLECISAMRMIDMIENLIFDRDILKEAGEALSEAPQKDIDKDNVTEQTAQEDSKEEKSEGLKCKDCGAELLPESKFCVSCGSKVKLITENKKPKFCINCGAKLKAGAKFCSKCGNKLDD